MTTLSSGSPAPGFSLPCTVGPTRTFEPALPGRKVLVFYKVDCPTCAFALPHFDRLHRLFDPEGKRIWAVAQDSQAEAAQFSRAHGVRMPQLVDLPPYPVSRMYGLVSVPTLLLVDGSGRVELVSPAFVKEHVEEAARLLALEAGLRAPELFAEAEGVPALKPG